MSCRIVSCLVLSRLFARSPVSECYFYFYLFVCCRREKLLLLPLPCPLQAPLGLHAQKEYSPPHTHTPPQSIVICSNFHLACTQIDSDKRKTRIPIAYMANMHSGKQPQCILGVVSQPGVDSLSQRLCKFTLCQLWLLFWGRCRNHKLIYYIKANLITSWGSWADCSWRKMGEFSRITEIPGTATCWDFPSLGSLQWHND